MLALLKILDFLTSIFSWIRNSKAYTGLSKISKRLQRNFFSYGRDTVYTLILQEDGSILQKYFFSIGLKKMESFIQKSIIIQSCSENNFSPTHDIQMPYMLSSLLNFFGVRSRSEAVQSLLIGSAIIPMYHCCHLWEWFMSIISRHLLSPSGLEQNQHQWLQHMPPSLALAYAAPDNPTSHSKILPSLVVSSLTSLEAECFLWVVRKPPGQIRVEL